MRFSFIRRHRSPRQPVGMMCRVLGVSRSGFYRWASRKPSRREQANQTLVAFLRQEAEQQHGIPGYRKLWHAAVQSGFDCSQNRVQRLLQRMGYRSVTAPRPGWRKPQPGIPVRPNLLNREFCIDEPDRSWVSDITQVRCQEGWLYIATVMDLYSRRIVGHACSARADTVLVKRAIDQALGWRSIKPGNSLFHSDQGVQYRSEEVLKTLSGAGFTISMSRRGNCWDNACAESFFSLMKREWLHHLGLISRREMADAVAYYIGEYYDNVRSHKTLGGLTPRAYELAA